MTYRFNIMLLDEPQQRLIQLKQLYVENGKYNRHLLRKLSLLSLSKQTLENMIHRKSDTEYSKCKTELDSVLEEYKKVLNSHSQILGENVKIHEKISIIEKELNLRRDQEKLMSDITNRRAYFIALQKYKSILKNNKQNTTKCDSIRRKSNYTVCV